MCKATALMHASVNSSKRWYVKQKASTNDQVEICNVVQPRSLLSARLSLGNARKCSYAGHYFAIGSDLSANSIVCLIL